MTLRPLEDVATLVAGQHIESTLYSRTDSGIPYLTGPADFTSRYPHVTKWTAAPKVFARSSDVLVTVKGAGVGKVNWGCDAAIGRQLMAIRPRADLLDQAYLFHFMKSQEHSLNGSAQGATVPGIGKDDLLSLRIPVPPLPEQRRIAEILDKADALRVNRRAALAQLDTLTQSIFLDMFGGPEAILKRWTVDKLGCYLTFLTSGSRGWADHYAGSGDVFLRIQNVGKDEVLLNDIAHVNAPNTAEATRTRVAPGDVLLSITADLGRTAVVPPDLGPAFINQHLAILRVTELEPRYLSAFLTSPLGQEQVQRRNRQGVKAGLNFDDIRSFMIPVPSSELQRTFARAASKVDGLKMKLQRSADNFLGLFASLQHRAFRGEL